MVSKNNAQFWAVIISSLGLILITITLIAAVVTFKISDTDASGIREAMLLVVGGVISQASAGATWLFSERKNNNVTHVQHGIVTTVETPTTETIT